MKTKNKIILLVISIISFTFFLITIDMIYNFRSYGIKSIDDKAKAIAKTVEHSLTSQMVSGVIDDRELFLGQLEDIPNIDKIWLSRGQKVIDMYGKGLNNETARDEVDRQVLETGETKKVVNDHIFSQSTYRITIPYNATSKGKIDCMSCHTNAQEGDTLGAISIQMSIDDSKQIGIKTITDTLLIALVLMIVIIFLLNFLISPFLSLFDSIKKVMNKAQQGDYSYRIKNPSGKEAKDVALWINGLLEKLEITLEAIDSKISIFLSENHKITDKDHLINVKNTVDRLSDVYKFRKTIEYDETIDDVYNRLAEVLKIKLGITKFNFFEISTISNECKLVHNEAKIICKIFEEGCRADRTNTIIDSTQFKDICPSCKACDKQNYFCVPYAISNELDLIISIYTDTVTQTVKVREMIPYIQDYVDAAKTVIVSKKLMNILEHNAQTDALTGLKNRKYLEDITPKVTSQTKRSGITYGVLLLDIDFFKMVNDTYGHDVGDNAIKIVSQTLNENIRESDIAVRYGGEEFVVLLYNCDEQGAIDVAQKIRTNFSKKNIPTGGTNFIQKTMSIGVSIFPNDTLELEESIKFADLALYEAKNSGRNKVVRFDKTLVN
ncbi:GGDEF domain-containing protein [Halarcobacter mediterraneus]|uniref:diguanylate cyclase n=1 Tax=Halarcobacter mediterraneus TaxID=2023153 RepID=A0A4Q1AV57_9BACT|nr:GGDEF domain-containing protein [Halarcobacter mediterraneus]RXK13316.1 GGDEF domain-containing protein [Halarcobacter mediterraneus]